MAEEEGKKEDQFGFTPEGEAMGYISLEQARVVAMQTARDQPGAYGSRFANVRMVFDVVQQEEGEDYYIVTLSVRPEGDFDGRAGEEQFFIEKEGTVAHRNLRSLPRSRKGGFPKGRVAIGLGIVAVIAVLFVALTIGRDGDEPPEGPEQAAQVVGVTPPGPTDTPIAPGPTKPTPTFTPTPAVITPPKLPKGFVLNVQGIPVGPGQTEITVTNGVILLSEPPGRAGMYPDDVELTLTASPDLPDAEIVWTGVDTYSGSRATVSMKDDRAISVSILPGNSNAGQACVELKADVRYSGKLLNETASLGSEMDGTFSQFGCEVTGFIHLSSVRLAGSGPVFGFLEDDTIFFMSAGDANDLGRDLFFEGTWFGGELEGSFTVSDTGEVGIWALFPEGGPPTDYPALLNNDHGHHMGIATSISPGSFSGTIDPAPDVDLFRFFAQDGESYAIEVAPGSHPDTFLTLYDSEGFAIEENDDAAGLGTGSGLEWTAPFTGDYFVGIRSLHQDFDTGSYVLSLTILGDDHGDSFDSASVISPGYTSGTIDRPFDVDFFSFFAEGGDSFTVEAMLETNPGTYIVLYDFEGFFLTDNDDAAGLDGGSRISWTASFSADYYVEVRSSEHGQDTGSYLVNLLLSKDDHGDTLDRATGISDGSFRGAIETGSDVDYFGFIAEPNTSYIAEVQLDTHPDTGLTLLDGSGNFIVDNNDAEGLNGGSRVRWTTPPGRSEYFLVVSAAGPVLGTGSYILSVEPIFDQHGDSMGTATALGQGSFFSLDGVIEPAFDTDFFSFFAQSGESYVVEVELYGHPDTVLNLYNGRGLKLAENDDAAGLDSGSRISWTAPSAGEYFLEVRSYDQETQTGGYVLYLDRESPSISGFYTGSINSDTNITGRLELSLEEDGGNVGGYLTLYEPHVGSGELENASFFNGTLLFTVYASYQGVPYFCVYSAPSSVPEEDTLEGDYQCFEDNKKYEDGNWKATR